MRTLSLNDKKCRLILTVSACLSTVALAVINSSHGSMLTGITERYLDGNGARQGYPNSAMQAGAITAVLVLLFFGRKLSIKGKRILLALAAAVMGICMIFLGMEPSFIVFVGVFFIVGLAYGSTDVFSSALIADAYGENSSSMMCLLHGSHGAAGIITPLVIAAILSGDSVKWSFPYIYIGCFIIFLSLLLSVFVFFCRIKKIPENNITGTEKKYDNGENETVGNKAENQNSLEKTKSYPMLYPALSIMFYGVYLVSMICYTERCESAFINREGAALLTLSLLYVGLTAGRLILPLLKITSDVYLLCAPIIAAVILAFGVIVGNGTLYIITAALSSLIAGAYIPVAIAKACTLTVNTTDASTKMNLMMLVGNLTASPIVGATIGKAGMKAGMMIPAAALLLAGSVQIVRCIKHKNNG